jgi:hypothetical protein
LPPKPAKPANTLLAKSSDASTKGLKRSKGGKGKLRCIFLFQLTYDTIYIDDTQSDKVINPRKRRNSKKQRNAKEN